METNLLIDITGWVGVALLLIAYALVSIKKLEGDALVYQSLNLTGGALLIVNSFYYGAFPSVGINIAWIGIAVLTIYRKRRSQTNRSL
jgi:hypothetical protein